MFLGLAISRVLVRKVSNVSFEYPDVYLEKDTRHDKKIDMFILFIKTRVWRASFTRP